MAKNCYSSINGVHTRIKNDLDQNDTDAVNVVTIYAHNGSGKTRLSKHFKDQYDDSVLCYNAFVEDYFHWNNSDITFTIDPNSWIAEQINSQGLDNKISDNFKDFIGLNIESGIDATTGEITFNIPTGDAAYQNNIKISRGEESIFIFTVFYTIIETAIDELQETPENRSTHIFDNIKYVILDDPVSSLDDTRIIALALKIGNLIHNAGNHFRFLITTHHALFFNVLFNMKNSKWNKTNYILCKENNKFKLRKQCKDSPFAYHLTIVAEIKKAIATNSLKKHHYNLFRCLLEKTANFLGYSHWKKCLDEIATEDDFIKCIDHYSHERLSELEYNNLINANIEVFKATFNSFCQKYKWNCD